MIDILRKCKDVNEIKFRSIIIKLFKIDKKIGKYYFKKIHKRINLFLNENLLRILSKEEVPSFKKLWLLI